MKMSKGLEALDNLLNDELVKPTKYHKTIRDIASVGQVLVIEKSLKALEIIKEKEMLSVFKDINGKCFISFNNTAIETPQEEYDLLKEVLL